MTNAGWYELGNHASEPFTLSRVSITGGSETAETLGRFLLSGLTDTQYLGSLMARHGYRRVAQYVQERRVPTKLNIRVANFGEVASGHLLEEEEEALSREAREELGIKVLVLKWLGQIYDPVEPAVVHVYAVLSWEGEPVNAAPEEHTEVRWFGAGELPESEGMDAYLALVVTALG